MAHSKDTCMGPLMLIGQPAEETIGGDQGDARRRLANAPFPGLTWLWPYTWATYFPRGRWGSPLGFSTPTPIAAHYDLWQRRTRLGAAHGDRSHCDRCPIFSALQNIASREVKPQEMAGRHRGLTFWLEPKNNHHPDQAEMG